MPDRPDDLGPPLLHTDFVQGLDEDIRQINRETISRHIPEINRDTVLALARTVAELRARYLGVALLHLRPGDSRHPPEDSRVREIAERRRQYEESVHAFNALTRAIARGYVEMPELAERQ
ncbi:MAG: hypothetical protein WD270_07555 [Acetobacterales bacterium]